MGLKPVYVTASFSIDSVWLYILERGLGCPDNGNNDNSVFLLNPTSMPDNRLNSLPTLWFTLQHPILNGRYYVHLIRNRVLIGYITFPKSCSYKCWNWDSDRVLAGCYSMSPRTPLNLAAFEPAWVVLNLALTGSCVTFSKSHQSLGLSCLFCVMAVALTACFGGMLRRLRDTVHGSV